MYSLQRISDLVDGKVEGDHRFHVGEISSLGKATATSITFFTDLKKKGELKATRAGAVLISPDHAQWFPGNKVIVSNPYLAYARLSRVFRKNGFPEPAGIDGSALVADNCLIGDQVSIGSYSIISDRVRLGSHVVIGSGVRVHEEVSIGDHTVIESNAVISPGCRLGKRCHISPGVVIGSNGFGYAEDEGKWEKIEQLGGVEIGDDVDIGANTTIDRGALENTVIGNGVKLDNQIQIAHNVRIGDHTIMAGCSAIAGSTRIGRRCKIGGRVSILGHLQIVDDVTIYANGLVASSIKSAGEYASALPVQPARRWRKNAALIRRLDRLAKRGNGSRQDEDG
ncbi:MAG: UDP-3-O-(3-hydroxymyristoyl)glucosamine N-acyltransferase [Gammaproteobacteria bacterium]|nr:UDP-3-O-(3-hydroxymyristoyl)glucosamine N-acyltransferase [Gammaproteobacteria bacterium]